MKKITYCILTLLIICGISMYSSDDKVQEPSENDLRIWFPSGYEIMKRVDTNDIEVVQELEERLGFSLHYKAVSGDIDSSFQAQMSDLSDVDLLYYTFSTPQITSALKNGLFLNYSEYLDRMPHLKKEFEEHPELYPQAMMRFIPLRNCRKCWKRKKHCTLRRSCLSRERISSVYPPIILILTASCDCFRQGMLCMRRRIR